MKHPHQALNTQQLLGFADVTSEIDLSAPVLSGRVGAKVGTETITGDSDLDTTQLLGFTAEAENVDFRDPELDARVGAKVGSENP